jgi:diguanylate cyclase (GGDEF)-like protein
VFKLLLSNIHLPNTKHDLSTNVRVGDIACRYGGDESVVVMPGANAEDAGYRAETLRQEFSAMFKHDRKEISATVSIGISIYPQHGNTGDAIFCCADSALYQAKQIGRDKVQVLKEDRQR